MSSFLLAEEWQYYCRQYDEKYDEPAADVNHQLLPLQLLSSLIETLKVTHVLPPLDVDYYVVIAVNRPESSQLPTSYLFGDLPQELAPRVHPDGYTVHSITSFH